MGHSSHNPTLYHDTEAEQYADALRQHEEEWTHRQQWEARLAAAQRISEAQHAYWSGVWHTWAQTHGAPRRQSSCVTRRRRPMRMSTSITNHVEELSPWRTNTMTNASRKSPQTNRFLFCEPKIDSRQWWCGIGRCWRLSSPILAQRKHKKPMSWRASWSNGRDEGTLTNTKSSRSGGVARLQGKRDGAVPRSCARECHV